MAPTDRAVQNKSATIMTSESLPREMLTGPERDVPPVIIMGV